jgi:hypothetical protein
MVGTCEFYPYCYLLVAADTALAAAVEAEKHGREGKNYHYVVAAVFCAFAVEAVLNHVGVEKVSDWMDAEKEYRKWEDKLAELEAVLCVSFNRGQMPFQTVADAFRLRNNLAHGKTWVGSQSYFPTATTDHESYPTWLKQYLNEAKAKRVISDTRQMIETLLTKAGVSSLDLYKDSYPDFLPSDDPTDKPSSVDWAKKQGTSIEGRTSICLRLARMFLRLETWLCRKK